MQQQSSTSKSIVLKDVLFSYAYFAQPQVNKDKVTGKESRTYCVDAVFDPQHPAFALVRETVREVAKAAWGEATVKGPSGQKDPATGQIVLVDMPEWQAVLSQLNDEGRVPMRDGNRRSKQEEPYTGNFYVKANSSRQPRVVVTRGGVNVEIQADDPQYPYSGCRGIVYLDIWVQGAKGKPSPYGKRVNAQLTGVQFLGHGKRLGGGGRVAAMEEFELNPADADGAPPSEAPASSSGPSLI